MSYHSNTVKDLSLLEKLFLTKGDCYLFYLLAAPDDMCFQKFNVSLELFHNREKATSWKDFIMQIIKESENSELRALAEERLTTLYKKMVNKTVL